MVRTLISGGSGKVATDLVRDLVADGNTITATARYPENITQSDGVTAEKLDLHTDVDSIAKQVKGFDATYLTAGSCDKDLIQADVVGAIKTMMAAEKAGVKCYTMLSSTLNLDINSRGKIPSLEDYLAARFFADTYLMSSMGLEYTILQPGSLTEAAGTSKIQLDVKATDSNPISDIAKTLAAVLKYPSTISKIIPMSSGKTSIDGILKET